MHQINILCTWNLYSVICQLGFCRGSVVKNLPVNTEDMGLTLGQEDSLEKEMAIHSSMLAWEIPWIEEAGGLQLMGSWRVGHDLVTKQQNNMSIISQ